MGLLYLPCKLITYHNVYKVIHVCEVNKYMPYLPCEVIIYHYVCRVIYICEVNKCMLRQYIVSAQ